MPWGLERWHGGHDLHFITFSCYRRQALLSNPHRCELFLKVLEDVRRRYQWVVIGYVVMPEHVHLLVSEPQQRPLATAIQALKLGFSRRLLAEERRLHQNAEHDKPGRVWQARYYDFNVCTPAKRVEKLRYLHRNRGEAWSGGSTGAMAVEQLPRIRVPGEGTGPRERMERAEAEVCPTNSFPALTLRPGLETRETRGTRLFASSSRSSTGCWAPRTKHSCRTMESAAD